MRKQRCRNITAYFPVTVASLGLGGPPATDTPPPPPTAEPPTAVPATNTPLPALPTNTPTAGPTAANTPADFFPTAVPCGEPPTIRANSQLAVRQGPGNDYSLLVTLPAGSVRPIIGRAEPAQHWQIELADGRIGWVPDQAVTVNGYTGNVPLAALPPINGNTPTPASGPAWNPTPNPACITPTATATPTPTSTPTAVTPSPTPTAGAAATEAAATQAAAAQAAAYRDRFCRATLNHGDDRNRAGPGHGRRC
jgi:hypothetical protein